MKFSDISSDALLLFASLLMITFNLLLYSFIKLITLKTERTHRLVSFIYMIINYMYVNIIGNYLYSTSHGIDPGKFTNFFMNFPIVVSIIIMIYLYAMSAAYIIFFVRYKKRNITALSIKESLDTLPTGILIYGKNGITLLKNDFMVKLIYELTGHPITNCNDIQRLLFESEYTVANGYIETIIKVYYEYYAFRYRKILYNEFGNVNEIIALNISEEYLLNQDLQEMNSKLKDYNEELKKLNETVEENTRNEELLNAKLKVHDSFGEALLMTKTLNDLSSDDLRKSILDSWKSLNSTLLISREYEEKVRIQFSQILDAAKHLGVHLIINGDITDNDLVYTAIHECLTNTVKHGHGDEMQVDIKNVGNKIFLKCSNNGEIPETFTPKGGIQSLFNKLKNNGGLYEVSLEDRFEIKFIIIKEE